MKYSLAFDLGATSIRGILGYVEDGKLKTEEVLRFSHERIKENGRSRWDWNKIIKNIGKYNIKIWRFHFKYRSRYFGGWISEY